MLHLMETSFDATEEFRLFVESLAGEELDPIEIIAAIEEEYGMPFIELARWLSN